MKYSLIFFLLIFHQSINLFSQPQNPRVLEKIWDAYWITVPEADPYKYGVYHFRKNFELEQQPQKYIIHVSGDNRYKLFVNGQLVSVGPAKSDLAYWNFETVNIASFLKKGKNTIASTVWNFGYYRAEAQISNRSGFIVQADSSVEAVVNTDESWECIQDFSYDPVLPNLINAYYAAGPGEQIDFRKYPQGWELGQDHGFSWQKAGVLMHGLSKGVFDWDFGWMLVPRSIPEMEMKPQRLSRCRLAEGIEVPSGFPQEEISLTVPQKAKVKLILDQDRLTTAYSNLTFSKGKDSKIILTYSEGLYVDEHSDNWKNEQQKGNRNDIEGKRFVGLKDIIISSGSENQNFTSLWWRTYRYVQLEIETKDEPLVIDDFSGISTAYPFELKAVVDFHDSSLNQIFDIGWRTARLCAGETYMDTPYYEQLQYVGDTRIQSLISLFNTGDDRLMRNAIEQINNSRMAEGITLSRFPTAHTQQIPPFSLWWIGMLHDYWMYRPDSSFVKNMLPGVRQVLSFFERFQQNDGSLKNAPYWEFTDWAEGNGWLNGVAPSGADGCSAVLDLQLLWAFQLAAELEANMGLNSFAEYYHNKATLLQKTILIKYWDSEKKLLADNSSKVGFSQHANILGVMTGALNSKNPKDIMIRVVSDSGLTQASIYFQYYLNMALNKVGLGDDYLNRLNVWKENIKNGLTTWAEMSDINRSRSDCHAWGSSPNIEFLRIVLGINTDAPGFSKIRIRPNLGKLVQASGTMPHPSGTISVDYTLADNQLIAKITIPVGVPGIFEWKGKEYKLNSGRITYLEIKN